MQYCVETECFLDITAQLRYNYRDDNLSCFSSAITLPIMEGWLMKKSANVFVAFQRRYFRLKDKKLYYYRKSASQKHAGVINFDLVTVHLDSFDLLIELKPLGSKRKFVVAAESKQSLYEWRCALMQHISHSEGFEQQLPAPLATKEWWRFDSISDCQFESIATTGDILLFRSLNTLSSLSRVFTNSDYDHIAMVLRYSSGRLALLEAVYPSVCPN